MYNSTLAYDGNHEKDQARIKAAIAYDVYQNSSVTERNEKERLWKAADAAFQAIVRDDFRPCCD